MQQIDHTDPSDQLSITEPVADAVTDEPSSANQTAPPRSELKFADWGKKLRFFNQLQAAYPDNDLGRRQSLLNGVMVAVGLFVLVALPTSALLGLLDTSDWWAVGVVGLAALLAFSLNQFGHLKPAAYLFLLGIELALVIRSFGNFEVSPALVSFNFFTLAVCIAMAGLVIDELAPFIIGGIGLSAFVPVFIAYSQAAPNETGIIIQMAVYGASAQVVMAFMSWASARAISRALGRMVWQNEQLLEVNDQLTQNLHLDNTLGDAISQLSSDLSQISHDQSQRAQSQAQSVAIVTSTLEELSATARQIAEVAEGVFTATEQALQTAEEGGQSVGLGIDSIASLIGHVEGISNIANELGNQSRRISEIVETISELAEETNLLALNATIEAAGAGEYGRRFAVVASEVQMLANRSRAASRDVQTILGQIRNSINNTLSATTDGLDEARRMSEVAGQAGESIEQIIETVESTTYLARQIHLTTQQQRTATDQAVEMIRQVTGDAREAAARAQQLLIASDRLSQTATSLRRD